jgi:hypothetical protein
VIEDTPLWGGFGQRYCRCSLKNLGLTLFNVVWGGERVLRNPPYRYCEPFWALAPNYEPFWALAPNYEPFINILCGVSEIVGKPRLLKKIAIRLREGKEERRKREEGQRAKGKEGKGLLSFRARKRLRETRCRDT